MFIILIKVCFVTLQDYLLPFPPFFFTFSLVVVVEGISGSRETTWFVPDDSRADSLMRQFLSGCCHFERAGTRDHWSCDGAVVSGCR